MNSKKDLQEKVVEMENLRAQSNALQQQLMIVMNTLQEIKAAKKALDDINTLDEKDDILVPLGGGAYINATLGDTSKVMLNLGADVMARKNRSDALDVLEDQINQLEDAENRLENAMQTIDSRMNMLSMQLQKLLQAKK